MTRQRNPFRWVLGRALLAWLSALTLVVALAAAPASATPEGDADVAITDAWNAAGGPTSPLGERDGGVYAVGGGFGQNFVGGAIFYTPATGAHTMFGAILDRYRALGGPADSGLGFPTVDEGPGRVSPESRNSIFSAADNPVIFWTPESGAWVVRGAMNAAWDHLGGSAGVLGVPIEDETYNGSVITQRFSAGLVSYDTATGTFTTEPGDLAGQLVGLPIPGDATTAINTAYRTAGGAEGPLGAREGEQYAVGDDGVAQNFAGGKIFYTPGTGARALTGAVLERYESAGGPTGELGFPTSGEVDGGVPDSRQASFAAADHPVIFWTQDNGAIVVNGPVKAAWDKLGGPTGALGVPTAEHKIDGDVMSQKFTGGEVSWNAGDRTFTTSPPELADALEGIEVPNQPLPSVQSSDQPGGSASGEDTGSGGAGWLWWLLPVLLLLGLGAWLFTRRRSTPAVGAEGGRYEGDAARYADDAPRYDEDAPRYDEDAPRYDEDAPRYSGGGSAGAADRFFSEYDSGPGYTEERTEWIGDDRAETTQVVIHDELFTHPPADDDHAEAAAEDDYASDDFVAADRAEAEIAEGEHTEDDYVEGDHVEGEFDEDEDRIDTAPTRFDFSGLDVEAEAPAEPLADETPSGRHARIDSSLPPLPDWGAKYGAFEDRATSSERRWEPEPEQQQWEPEPEPEPVREPEPEPVIETAQEPSAYPAIHLPLEDPHQAPEGFSIKACMRSGNYYVPGGAGYEETVADIWFADEGHAQANGFHRAD